jgi:DNA-binding transcriptional LysR family regulator
MRQIHLERFDLNLLLVFDTLMRERHAGRTGEALGLTQPAVSHALTRLRQILNDPLFEKYAKGMRPTPRAEAMAGPVASALQTLRLTLNEERPFDPAQASGSITIGGNDYINFALMPELLPVLRKQAPGLDIRLRPTSQAGVLQQFRRREIALALGPMAAAPKGVKMRPLFTERLILIARKGHPALKKPPTLEALAELPHLLVSPSGEGFGIADEALREAGFSRRIAVTVPDFLAAPFIVGATDLVALLAERVARKLAQSAGLSLHEQPVANKPWAIGLGYLPNAVSDPAVEWLIEQIASISSRI